MPPIATELNDRSNGWWPQVTDTESGMVGVRFFRVNTMSEIKAQQASGLPQVGDVWQEVFTDLLRTIRVRTVDPEVLGGHDVTDTGGWTVVRVEYAEQGFGSIDPDDGFEAGDSYSAIAGSIKTVQVGFDVDGSKIPATQKEVTTDELIVTSYQTASSVIAATPTWFSIRNTVNSNLVIIPSLWRTSSLLVVAPGGGSGIIDGELLARARSVRPITSEVDLYAVEYRFGFGPTGAFKYVWRPEDENGASSGPEVFSDVQEVVAWPSLIGVLW